MKRRVATYLRDQPAAGANRRLARGEGAPVVVANSCSWARTDVVEIPLPKGIGVVLDNIGIWAFFVVIGGFSVWVIGTFFKSIRLLKGGEVSR